MTQQAAVEDGTPIKQEVQGYCFKCSTNRPMANAVTTTLKNGRPAARGNCNECNAKTFRIGKYV